MSKTTSSFESSWTVVGNSTQSAVEEIKENEIDEELSDGISIISESDNSHCDDAQNITKMVLNEKSCKVESTKESTASEEKDVCKNLESKIQQIEPYTKLVKKDETFIPGISRFKFNLTWKFLLLLSILLLAFAGTLSHFWINDPKDLDLRRKLKEVTTQNELLRLEITEKIRIIETYELNGCNQFNYKTLKKINTGIDEKIQKYESTETAWSERQNINKLKFSKEESKTPYNCKGIEEDIAGFCVPNKKDLNNGEPATKKTLNKKSFIKDDSEENSKHKDVKYQTKRKKTHSSEERKYKQSKEKYEKVKNFKNKQLDEKKNKKKRKYSKEYSDEL